MGAIVRNEDLASSLRGQGGSLFGDDGVVARFRIGNFRHIAAAYGQVVAQEVMVWSCAALRGFLSEDVEAVPGAEAVIDIKIRSGAEAGDGGRRIVMSRLEVICEALILTPVETQAGKVHIWVSPEDYVEAVASTGDLLKIFPPFAGDPPRSGADWGARYRADMALTCKLLAQLQGERVSGGNASSRLVLRWQAVRGEQGVCLYCEALTRLISDAGREEYPGEYVEAIERLGFVRVFDREIAARVLVELEVEPDARLGCNISARSARWDDWWEGFSDHLARFPWLARRLVIEITETASIQDASEAATFVDRLRRLGCRVALDDFGVGYASIRTALAMSPDIVKIDSFFLSQVAIGKGRASLFEGVVGLAKSLASIVVVEGVETAEQADLVKAVGVEWMQGRYWGAPAAACRWSSRQLSEIDRATSGDWT